MNKEIWKAVKGFEKYEVSNTGEVRSTKYKKPRIMKQSLHTSGYRVIPLSDKGVRKTTYIHRLMAEAFIPNPEDLPAVLFRDRDKNNITIENLMWCTRETALKHYHNTKDIIPTTKVDVKYLITKGTKKHKIYTLLLDDPTLSNADLAELVGCHKMYANQIKRELIQRGYIQKVQKIMDKEAKRYIEENLDERPKVAAIKFNIPMNKVYSLRSAARRESLIEEEQL